MVVQDQAEAVAFLESLAPPGRPAERVETHGGIVVLAGDRAYKLRRAVRLPYLDYSTPPLRRRRCEDEVAINAPHAPGLYLGVRAIVRDGAGRLRFAGDRDAGDAVEWVTVMTRFPAGRLLDRVAVAGGLTPALALELADRVAAMHHAAPVAPADAQWGGAGRFRATLAQTLGVLAGAPETIPPAVLAPVAAAAQAAAERLAPRLDARRAGGHVRRCHGDLHLGNIVLLDDGPVPFDAIDFNDALAWIDTLHDAAFLLMDLDRRGLRDRANPLLGRYLAATGDWDGLDLLPLYLADKALVRALAAVTTARTPHAAAGAAGAGLAAAATGYLAAAGDYLAPPPPILVAIGGPSGSGKSTLAAGLAPLIGASPGAVHLRTDAIRKRLAGLAETDRLPPAAYTPASHAAVYAELERIAATVLRAGHAVIVDGVFGQPDGRARIAALASGAGAAFRGLWLAAPEPLLAARVAARRGDASDATPAVVRAQLAAGFGTVEWTVVDASGAPEAVCARAIAALGLSRAAGAA